jgi:hypothetical protein
MRGMAGAQKLLGSCDLQQSVGNSWGIAQVGGFAHRHDTLSTLKGASPETLRCFKALRAEVCPDTIVILVIRPNVSPDVWNRPALIEAASDPRDDFSGLTRVKAQVSLGPQEVYVFYGGSFENSTVIACRPVEGKDCCRTATFASRSVVSLCRIASLEANCRTGGVFTRVCSR